MRDILKVLNNYLLIFGLIFLNYSCNFNNTDVLAKNEIKKRNTDTNFLSFLKQFKPLKYPVKILDVNNLNYESMPVLKGDKNDTLFFQNGNLNFCYGLLPDTNKFYALIIIFPTDMYIPVLLTFSGSGKKISEAPLYISNGLINTKSINSLFIDDRNIITCIDTLFSEEKKVRAIQKKQWKIFENGLIKEIESARK